MRYGAAPFVGRERELSAIEDLLDRAAKRDAVVLNLVGEPGIGKTRLLREALERGRVRGFAAYIGHGSDLESEIPYGLLIETFESAFTQLRSDAPEHERHAIGRSVAHLVEKLTVSAPVMVVVDDVHWADAASVTVLAHLVDRLTDAPLLIAFAARPGHRHAALESAFDRAERDDRIAQIELAPLGPEHLEGLLGETLPEPLREELMRESGGNPFYLEQLARALPGASGSHFAGAALGGVPPAVARALGVELSDLAPAARTVAHALAVAGDGADTELVTRVAGVERRVALKALDELADADVVRASAEAPTFAFRHPIVRRTVYESAPTAWRIDAHRRAADELRERGAPTARRAHHEEHSAAAGDREAIELLAQAANECRTVAPATAVRYYGAALRLLPGGEAQGPAGLRLRVPLAFALALSGAMDDSLEALRDTVLALPEEDRPTRIALVTTMAAIEHLLGRYDEGRELLQRELATVPAELPAHRARLLHALAYNHYLFGNWDAMREASVAGFALADTADDMAVRAQTAGAASVSTGALADREDADAWLAHAREAFDALPAPRLLAHLDAAFWCGLAELHLEHHQRARRVFERGLDLSRRSGQESAAVQLCVGLASVCALTGRLTEGRKAASYAVDVARLAGVPNLLGWAEIARCWIALQEGRLDEALEAGAYVERTVAELGTPAFSGGICALAEARVLAGDAGYGRDGLLAAARGDDLPDLIPPLRTWAYGVLTQAELSLGDFAAAGGWAERAAASAPALGLNRDRSFAELAAAGVAVARGDDHAGAERAAAAVEAAHACGLVPQAIRGRIVGGIATGRLGDREAAVALLEAAHRDARACGAAHERNQAASALRELGRRPGGRSAATAGSHLLAGLTQREREVAGLVADRLRNREIAERLHLSEKTVERHVSGILGKLGVDSRVEIARAVDRERASR